MAPSTSLPNLHESLGVRFEEAQNSLVNHRKNCAGLYKTHVQAAKSIKKDFDGEQAFGDVFIDLVSRVMDVKKGPCADRTVRFVGSYVKFINDKDDAEETPVSRFTSRLLYWLLKGFHAKNKTVRFRAVSIVAEMMAHLGEIDGDTYDALRRSLIKRIYDKESTVRSQAVIALSKLVGTEEVDELEPGEKTILELMLEIMSFDPSAEVRRAAIVSIPLTPESLDAALARTRDTDTLTRKLVYSVFKDKLHHPRQLTISQREDMIKTGLGDREAAVRVAVGKLLETWFDIALAQVKEPEEQSWTGDDSGVMRGFIQFLTFFDVVGPGEAVAADAMLSIFTTRPKLSELFVFQDAYWTNLTPESAVLARVFVEHSFSTGSQERLDTASLPVVTAFAFHIQEAYNGLLAILQEVSLLGTGDDEESEVREEEIAKKEVVLGELLRMSLKLDYMDEIGRRKVFSVTTDMLAHPQLPPGLLGPCLDLLKEIMPSERDLIRVVVETVIELREDDEQPDEPGDTSHSDISQATLKKDRLNRRSKQLQEMSEEEKRDSDLTDLRCLTLCIGMLERVNGTFEDNSTLEGILADLIIPAVKRKELAMREKGLVALGLCCLIAKNMALNSFQLFFSQVQTAPEELLLNVLQIIFDLLIVYESQFLGRSEEVAQGIITFLLGVLNAAESDCVQAILCMGLAKLLLAGLITDPRVLTSLLLTYISPSTKDNAELRQCLSYFFPAYCYSSGDNQDRMRSVFMSAYDLVISVHDELDDDQEMITPYQFGQLMIDWTNPAKAAYNRPSRCIT
ncbi:nuclear condensing complex subunit [Mycena floridula]|nr:nuclear condensing complex subunit [Mycena floridula]